MYGFELAIILENMDLNYIPFSGGTFFTLPILTRLVYFHLISAQFAIGPILLSYLAAPGSKYTPEEKLGSSGILYGRYDET